MSNTLPTTLTAAALAASGRVAANAHANFALDGAEDTSDDLHLLVG